MDIKIPVGSQKFFSARTQVARETEKHPRQPDPFFCGGAGKSSVVKSAVCTNGLLSWGAI